MKRVLALLIVLCMIMSMAACQGNKAETKETGKNAENAENAKDKSGDKTYRIGFSNASISNSWRVKMRDMLVAECEKRGIELIETDAHDDANTQNSNIESMLQQDLDAILIAPVVEDAVNPGIEAAYASGIPVIIFDRHASTEDYTHFVGYSDKQNGAECAQMLVDALTE